MLRVTYWKSEFQIIDFILLSVDKEIFDWNFFRKPSNKWVQHKKILSSLFEHTCTTKHKRQDHLPNICSNLKQEWCYHDLQWLELNHKQNDMVHLQKDVDCTPKKVCHQKSLAKMNWKSYLAENMKFRERSKMTEKNCNHLPLVYRLAHFKSDASAILCLVLLTRANFVALFNCFSSFLWQNLLMNQS